MKIGYMRISRDTQTTALQEDALAKEQCERVFTDTMSGTRFDRPEFLRMLDIARAGDIIVVWRWDRLGRSLGDLIGIVKRLEERGIELHSICEQIDTSTATGKLMFHLMASLGEFERNLLYERTMAGLKAARARGRKGGRPPITQTVDARTLARARELYNAKQNTVPEILRMTGLKKSSFYTYVVQKKGEH